MRQEKDQKHQLLQQRVKIQRELIEKNDEMANDLRARAELERLEVCVCIHIFVHACVHCTCISNCVLPDIMFFFFFVESPVTEKLEERICK